MTSLQGGKPFVREWRDYRLDDALYFIVGVGLSFYLADMAHFQTHKFLNVIGKLYSLLSFIVLSEFLGTNRYREFIVNKVSKRLLAAHYSVPIGAMAGALMLMTFDLGIPATVSSLVRGSLWLSLAMLPIAFVLEHLVCLPKLVAIDSVEMRSRIFGAFLALVGIAIQLAAAIADFIG